MDQKHYARLLFKFLSHIDDFSYLEDCWKWTGRIGWSGYGHLKVGNDNWYAHRLGYFLWYGELPDNLKLDHICRDKLCVNPLHLEAVDHPTNILRGNHNGYRTHCKHGHEFTEENTIINRRYGFSESTYRRCRACMNISNAKRKEQG